MPTRPYRWGQFQGLCVAFVGLVMIVGGLWVHDTHGMMLALFGFFFTTHWGWINRQEKICRCFLVYHLRDCVVVTAFPAFRRSALSHRAFSRNFVLVRSGNFLLPKTMD